MAKRAAYQYRLTLEQLVHTNGETGNKEPLTLKFENHNEIFGIIERLKQKNPFNDTSQATEFAIG